MDSDNDSYVVWPLSGFLRSLAKVLRIALIVEIVFSRSIRFIKTCLIFFHIQIVRNLSDLLLVVRLSDHGEKQNNI